MEEAVNVTAEVEELEIAITQTMVAVDMPKDVAEMVINDMEGRQ